MTGSKHQSFLYHPRPSALATCLGLLLISPLLLWLNLGNKVSPDLISPLPFFFLPFLYFLLYWLRSSWNQNVLIYCTLATGRQTLCISYGLCQLPGTWVGMKKEGRGLLGRQHHPRDHGRSPCLCQSCIHRHSYFLIYYSMLLMKFDFPAHNTVKAAN